MVLLAGLTVALRAAPSVPEDFRLLKEAAERGEPEAQFLIGLQYQDGHGVKRSQEEAVRWLRQAAESGHAEAQYVLGDLLAGAKPEEAKTDEEEAEKWLTAAAAQGNMAAIARLGALRAKGSARHRFRTEQAASTGNPAAIPPSDPAVTSGAFPPDTQAGPLVEDPAETMRWRLLLSGLRGADAFLVRGYLLENGIYVNRDLAMAADSYRKAAELGHPVGQFRLGLMYARGAGVERNVVEACAWLGLAEAGGLVEAKEALAAHRKSLTSDEMETVERRVRSLASARQTK